MEDGEVDDSKAASIEVKSEPSTIRLTESKPSASPLPAAAEPRKSDVLVRREQILRDRDAKNALTQPTTNVPERPDLPRNASGPILDRSNPNLPNRPDAPFPSHRIPERHPSSRHGGDRRDSRDVRLLDSNRLDRPGDKPREFSGHERRDLETSQRDFGRPSERGIDRPRSRPDPPPRWTPESSRENQERAVNGSRLSDSNGRLSRENMPPPRLSTGSMDRTPLSDRLPPLNPERQDLINPERAALITGTSTPPRSDSPRRGRDELKYPRDRMSSRQQSPRRHGSDRDYGDSRRDERPSRNVSEDLYNSHTGSEEAPLPPIGPRSDRPLDRGTERGPVDRRDASSFQPAPASTRTLDPDHGRLNPNVRPQADPNFGRLNTSPVTDIPSGPRDRNQRLNRIASGPQQPRHDGRSSVDSPRPPTPEKLVPTGPSSDRQPRRTASGQFDSVPHTPSSVPNTPSGTVAVPPIHPDRLRHIGPSTQPLPPPPPANTSGVHADRATRLDSGQSGTPSQANNRFMPSIVTAGPPSGPKGSQSSPASSGPTGLAAPTGPASAVERARGGRRQLAGINTMLQQAGQNAPDRMNVRGRGRMSSSAQAETPLSGPTTPSVAFPPPPLPGGPPSTRTEAGRELVNPERADLITGNAAPYEERDRGGRRDRSGRHSRRASGSPSGADRGRDAKRPGDDERGGREHRDRHDSGRSDPSERDRHQGRDQVRDLAIPRDPNGISREGARDRERDRERDRDPLRRDARDRDGARETHNNGWAGSDRGERGGERGGRSRDMRGDDRREHRITRGDDGGRKRRSDEGGMERGHDKRPRR